MARNIRVRGVRRKAVDEDKLALAFLMLAKVLHESAPETAASDAARADSPADPEAA